MKRSPLIERIDGSEGPGNVCDISATAADRDHAKSWRLPILSWLRNAWSSPKLVAPECAHRWGLLMAAAQGGDADAYKEVLGEIARWVRTLGSDLHHEEISEEAVCAVLLRVHRARFTYDPRRPFGPWISAVTGYSLQHSAIPRATDLSQNGRAHRKQTSQCEVSGNQGPRHAE